MIATRKLMNESMPASFVSRLAAPFVEFGPMSGALYVISRVLQRLSSDLNLFVYDIVVQPVPARALPAGHATGLQVRRLAESDPWMSQIPVPREVVVSRFNQKAICLGAFSNDDLVGYQWFCYEAYDEDEIRCRYVMSAPAESVFDFDLYIFPRYRLGRTFARMWQAADAMLANQGVRYTFSRISRFNLASRRSHARLGARRIGQLLCFRFWDLEAVFATIAPYVNVSISRNSRVQIRLTVGEG